MDPYLLFVLRVISSLFVSCRLVVTCWENADLLYLVCVMFACVFVTLPYGILGQVWYLIVWIPYLCYFFLTCVYRLSVLCLGQNRIIAVRFQHRLLVAWLILLLWGIFLNIVSLKTFFVSIPFIKFVRGSVLLILI